MKLHYYWNYPPLHMAIHLLHLHLHKPSIGPIRHQSKADALTLFCGWNSKLRPCPRQVVVHVQTPALVYTEKNHCPNAKYKWTVATPVKSH